MRRVFSVFMMMMSLLIGFQQGIILLHFKLNQARIEQQSCINKNVPERHCHGECQLKKRLQNTERHNASAVVALQKLEMIFPSFVEFAARIVERNLPVIATGYSPIIYTDPYREVFVPPPIA